MKKKYFSPEIEEIKLKMNHAILIGSETQGGGIVDDNSGNVDPNPSTDPDTDFGW